MKIPDHIFKGYDIRAIVPDEMNKDNIYQIAQAILYFYQTKLGKTDIKIVTGRDMRLTSPKLYPVLIKALVDGGATVIDTGLVSTPTYYFAVIHLRADAGIQLTASHNPPEYNGLKMVMRDGDTISKIGKTSGILEIRKYAQDGVKVMNPGGQVEKVDNIVEKEIESALEIVDASTIKPLRIVADAANAMAITYLKPLFKKLPCELIEMNFELDGTFPAHQPDPLIFETLKDLQKRVRKEKADIGLAPDGDGDRLFFIDEKGQIVTGAESTALVARELLKRFPGETILYDVRYVMTPRSIIKDAGGESVVTPVGHAFITSMLAEHNGLYGGESSEHNFFRWTGNAESPMLMILLMLDIISASDKPLSELVAEVRRSYESGEFNYTTNESRHIIELLKEVYKDAKQIDVDGISIEYKDWRFNVRTSNTEPLMRLNLEAKSKALLREKLKEVQGIIERQGAEHKKH